MALLPLLVPRNFLRHGLELFAARLSLAASPRSPLPTGQGAAGEVVALRLPLSSAARLLGPGCGPKVCLCAGACPREGDEGGKEEMLARSSAPILAPGPFLSAVRPDPPACGRLHGASAHRQDPAAAWSLSECVQRGESHPGWGCGRSAWWDPAGGGGSPSPACSPLLSKPWCPPLCAGRRNR